jgi:hypothetical protein
MFMKRAGVVTVLCTLATQLPQFYDERFYLLWALFAVYMMVSMARREI